MDCCQREGKTWLRRAQPHIAAPPLMGDRECGWLETREGGRCRLGKGEREGIRVRVRFGGIHIYSMYGYSCSSSKIDL